MGTRWQIKNKIIIPHVLFWLAYMLYATISYGWEDTDSLTFRPIAALFDATLPINIVIVYVNLYVIMPMYYYRGRYLQYAVSLVLLLAAAAVLARLLTHLFIIPWEKQHDPVRYAMENKHFWIPVRIVRLALESCPIIAVTMLVQLMLRAYQREKDQRELEKEKFMAEMSLLKNQINPHFFFNTLNTLYGLILKKSDQSAQFTLRLADLMRYMLYDVGEDRVLLKDEINHIENYLKVEQLRFAERLELSFQCFGDIGGKMIAPLILLPFVENAFKHGIAEDAGWITININVSHDHMVLNVENSYPATMPSEKGGLGVANVKRRLELIYPGKHELELIGQDGVYEAILKLDL